MTKLQNCFKISLDKMCNEQKGLNDKDVNQKYLQVVEKIINDSKLTLIFFFFLQITKLANV